MSLLPPAYGRLLLAGLIGATLPLPGCGGGSGGGNGGANVTGSTEVKRSIITEHGWGLDPLAFDAVDISITGAGSGTVDATVEWTFASDDVDIYVTATACTPEMFANERCAYKAKADGETTKPERVSFSVSGGDTYRFWIVNFGPQRESGTFVAGLTQ
jgi:hypothetical protein